MKTPPTEDANHSEEWHETGRQCISLLTTKSNRSVKVEETAINILNEYSKNTNSNKSIEAIAGVCVIVASRIHDEYITIKEITTIPITDIDNREYLNEYHLFRKDLNSVLQIMHEELNIPIPIETPSALLDSIIEGESFNERTIAETRSLLRELEDTEFTSGKSPNGIIGAALYLTTANTPTEEKYTQKEIAEIADTTPVTIRKNKQKIPDTVGYNSLEK